MQYELVLQFDGAAIKDFDDLLKIELDLGLALGGEHVVDGHDFGSGEMNIFIHTNKPDEVFKIAKSILATTNVSEVVAAYRDFDSEDYEVIYPANYKKEFRTT
ncbi:MAG: hypothetical protein ACJAVI_001177 [Candidatus Azotimanducaceae bacterium]|jgi:hypothetical protein